MKRFIYTCIFAILAPCVATSKTKELKLWYKEPAKQWMEALPCGNGRLGSMVYGGIHEELIQMNEETLWSGKPCNLNPNTDASKYLPLIREALFADQLDKAYTLCKNIQGYYSESYMPMSDLHMTFPCSDCDASEYHRELNLNTAINTTSYKVNGITYKRETFISYPDQLIIIRVSADRKNSIGMKISLTSKLRNIVTYSGNRIMLKGTAPYHIEADNTRYKDPVIWEKNGQTGMRFATIADIENDGGTIKAKEEHIEVSRANSITIRISGATSYNGIRTDPQYDGKNEVETAISYLRKAQKKQYDTLKSNHIKDYQAIFNRVSLTLSGNDKHDRIDTRERLMLYENNNEDDKALEETYYQYNRYLLISCSRPGGIPANLQGIWNNNVRPPWNSNYTTNINTEMNYWPAEMCNMPETAIPVINFVNRIEKNGEETAKNLFNAKGWMLCHNSDLWGLTNPVGDKGEGDPLWANWYMGAPWLCQPLYEHFRFTLDKEYLATEAYPTMKKAAIFCLNWLIEDKEGNLVTAPSSSPENSYVNFDGKTNCVTIASTMDMAIIYDLFTNIIEASSILNIDASFRNELIKKRAKLYPMKIGSRGNLQEWFKDYADAEPHHRHMSHLFGLHPGHQITPFTTPLLSNACKKTLLMRGDEATGWSLGWKINLWARLLDGNHAYKLTRNLLHVVEAGSNNYRGGSYINMLCAHPPFQIDGNFGGLAGMTEMLLQTQNNEIHLLPALPDAWNSGEVTGLCARGGFVVSIRWNDNKLNEAVIQSKCGTDCTVRTSYPVKVIGSKGAKSSVFVSQDYGTFYITRFKTKTGKSYKIMRQLEKASMDNDT